MKPIRHEITLQGIRTRPAWIKSNIPLMISERIGIPQVMQSTQILKDNISEDILNIIQEEQSIFSGQLAEYHRTINQLFKTEYDTVSI